MKKNKVILVVDDDEDMRKYLRKMLEGMGHEVHTAEDSDGAIQKISQVIPHLILLDINLHEENGFNIVGQVRMLDPYKRIKIIMISSLSSKKPIELSKKVGADGYLIKPINNQTLLTTLKKMAPDLEFPQAINLDDKYSFLMAKCRGQIIKISEIALILRSKIKFKQKHKIQIECVFLQKNDLKQVQYIINNESVDISPGIYDTNIQMVGLSDDNQQTIRKMKTRKG